MKTHLGDLYLGTAGVKRGTQPLRLGLLLAYAVMTVWVQAGHRHGHEADAATRTRCGTGCGDPKPHYSGHPSPDLGHEPSDCPACQLRSNLYVECPTIPALGGQIVGRLPRAETDRPPARTLLRASCRAPPLA